MKINKKYLVFIPVVLIVLVISLFLINRKPQKIAKDEEIDQTEELIPTVDSSVKVDLTSVTGNKEILLSISNKPMNTESIDYELSYQTASQGLQGVIGTITDEKSIIEKKLTLGTCSSGTCVYHQVIGKIKLTLKFTGDYGEKLFEKEFSL